jgi:hypothetical protein
MSLDRAYLLTAGPRERAAVLVDKSSKHLSDRSLARLKTCRQIHDLLVRRTWGDLPIGPCGECTGVVHASKRHEAVRNR